MIFYLKLYYFLINFKNIFFFTFDCLSNDSIMSGKNCRKSLSKISNLLQYYSKVLNNPKTNKDIKQSPESNDQEQKYFLEKLLYL